MAQPRCGLAHWNRQKFSEIKIATPIDVKHLQLSFPQSGIWAALTDELGLGQFAVLVRVTRFENRQEWMVFDEFALLKQLHAKLEG